MAAENLMRYWGLLGLKPGAKLEQLETTFYVIIESFAENQDPDEAEAKRREELHHAYRVLRRACQATSAPAAKRPITMPQLSRGITAAALILLAAGVWLALNAATLRMALTRYETGDLLHLRKSNTPYGMVVGYEVHHRFAIGRPTPAYQIRLQAGERETVWLSARVVEKGMRR